MKHFNREQAFEELENSANSAQSRASLSNNGSNPPRETGTKLQISYIHSSAHAHTSQACSGIFSYCDHISLEKFIEGTFLLLICLQGIENFYCFSFVRCNKWSGDDSMSWKGICTFCLNGTHLFDAVYTVFQLKRVSLNAQSMDENCTNFFRVSVHGRFINLNAMSYRSPLCQFEDIWKQEILVEKISLSVRFTWNWPFKCIS